MKRKKEYKYLEKYLFEIQSNGKLYFSINDLENKFTDYSLNSIKMSLKRLNKKNFVRHISKGFYVIVPPEYFAQKVLPPELFIDAFMRHLNRKYYVGLLSAAFYHGASHQQPQEYFVIIEKPPMRSIIVEGLKINFVVKSNLEISKTENKKSITGYFNISTSEQTAIDLFSYQDRIGGLNRLVTILYELTDSIDSEKLNQILINCKTISVAQRLGYIMDKILKRTDIANIVHNFLKNKRIFQIPLKSDSQKKGTVCKKWKIIENYEIETDFVE